MNKSPEFTRVVGLLLMMVVIGSGFLGGIGMLFHYHGDRAPDVIESNFRLGIVVFTVSFVVTTIFIRKQHGNAWKAQRVDMFGTRRWRWKRDMRRHTEESRLRITHLAADPVRRKYAQRMEQGQHWTDEQIAYDLDPEFLMSCAHLQPIERAMRRSGISIRPIPFAKTGVDARCCLDMPALERHYDVKPHIVFATIPGDRQYDPEGAMLYCKEHRSSIIVVHPDEVRPDTPRFPREL